MQAKVQIWFKYGSNKENNNIFSMQHFNFQFSMSTKKLYPIGSPVLIYIFVVDNLTNKPK